MKKIYVLLATVLIAASSCKKETTAAFSTERTTVYLTESVAFKNTSKNGGSYSWDFGDGTTSTDANPTHAYNKAGTYNVTLTADGSVISHPIKVGNGTASYVVKNNTSLAFEAVSFYVDANSELLDPTEHGMLAASATSDTVFTSRNYIQLGGIVENRIFIVVNGYNITKFKHNDLVIADNTQVYFGDDANGNSKTAPAITRAQASYKSIIAQKANNKPMIYIRSVK